MERGSGVVEFDDTHKLLRKGAEPVEHGVLLSAPLPKTPPELYDWLGVVGVPFPVAAAPHSATVSPQAVTIPTTIRVGLSCTDINDVKTCKTCYTSCNVGIPWPLEKYVEIGLGQEWVESWATDSLKAGAVAYRSYGAYRVANPLSTVYDICSNASCQKFNPNFSPLRRTKDAVAATAGIVLTKDSSIIKAEYASETNGFDECGDGRTGSPSGSWPCMKDFVCQGSTPYGHARGMCQYGTQRWATGKNASGVVVTAPRDWRCILNHYYNANNNSKTVDPD